MVGPTASGKSALAVEIAQRLGAEIINADAYQIYAGLPLLTAQPEPALRAQVRHHLVGTLPATAAWDAEKFRAAAERVLSELAARGRPALIVGGSGLYVRALTEGLSPLPKANPALRARLEQCSAGELCVRLARLDPLALRTIDRQNKRRLIRAVEICLQSGQPVSGQRRLTRSPLAAAGVFVFREREELYARINARVEAIFAQGVVEEVRALPAVGPTAQQTLGLAPIRALLAGRMAEAECIATIQQATRRYAKRQLTWFRRQTSFEPLNLTRTGSSEAIEWIVRKARLSFAPNE